MIDTFAPVPVLFTFIQNNIPRISLAIGLLVGRQLMDSSSTMFANPIITIVRAFTYSEAGVRPLDAVIFIIMQPLGMLHATQLWRIIKR